MATSPVGLAAQVKFLIYSWAAILQGRSVHKRGHLVLRQQRTITQDPARIMQQTSAVVKDHVRTENGMMDEVMCIVWAPRSCTRWLKPLDRSHAGLLFGWESPRGLPTLVQSAHVQAVAPDHESGLLVLSDTVMLQGRQAPTGSGVGSKVLLPPPTPSLSSNSPFPACLHLPS